MPTIKLEVSEEIARKFVNKKIVKYEDLLEFENNKSKYFFNDEKVSLKELSNFLGSVISSKKNNEC